MTNFDVRLRGTDSSGRGIWATDYMWSWWLRVCSTLGFAPTITQGAFMARAGGGAAASAGVHDLGGCFDLRVRDLTDAQVDRVIRTCRQLGAAAWLRNMDHGGFKDPHIHLVLGADQPLSPGAKMQFVAYMNGRDGLAGNGKDYHWRPDPLVIEPPRQWHRPVRVVTANTNFAKGGDKALLEYLAERADVLLLQECKNIDVNRLLPVGFTSNQDRKSQARAGSVVAWNTHVLKPRRSVLRLIARRIPGGMLDRYANVQPLTVIASGERYRFVSAHHAPARYDWTWPQTLRALRRIRRRPKLAPIVLGIDANQDIDELARKLHLRAWGPNDGIVGILTAPKRIKGSDERVDREPKRRNLTDHPVVFVTLERK